MSLPLPSFLGISLHSNHLSPWAWILEVHHSFPECSGCCGMIRSLALLLRGSFSLVQRRGLLLNACSATRTQKLPVGFTDHRRSFPQKPEEVATDSQERLPTSSVLTRKLCVGALPTPELGRESSISTSSSNSGHWLAQPRVPFKRGLS